MTCAPGTSRASARLSTGTTTRSTPCRSAVSTAGRTPGTARTRPSSPSSPSSTRPSKASAGTASLAASTAAARARSKELPRLGSVAGESASVTRRCGHDWPELTTAARTRSRDSARAASGKPMTERPGRPSARSASTSTRWPSSPIRAMAHARARAIRRPPVDARARVPLRDGGSPRSRRNAVRAPALAGARTTSGRPASGCAAP